MCISGSLCGVVRIQAIGVRVSVITCLIVDYTHARSSVIRRSVCLVLRHLLKVIQSINWTLKANHLIFLQMWCVSLFVFHKYKIIHCIFNIITSQLVTTSKLSPLCHKFYLISCQMCFWIKACFLSVIHNSSSVQLITCQQYLYYWILQNATEVTNTGRSFAAVQKHHSRLTHVGKSVTSK